VRFDNLLGRVPHRQSLGFGGQAGGVGFGGGEAGGVPDHDYDRGLVQKLILVLLKCVALTTREARCGTGTYASQIIIYSKFNGWHTNDGIQLLIHLFVSSYWMTFWQDAGRNY
jgi:hypothetical protein